MLLLPRFGRAHTPGLSTAELTVQLRGRVDARFMFASREPLGDRRAISTPGDLEIARPDLNAFLLSGVDVTADGATCPVVLGVASLAPPDGLLLEASYGCPADAAEIGLTLYYLSALPRGHREIARIVAPGASSEAVLTGERRELKLRLPDDGRAAFAARRRSWRALASGAFLLALGALGAHLWRGRAARRRPS